MAEGDLGAPRAGGYVMKPCHCLVSCILLIPTATPSTSVRRPPRTSTSGSKRCQSKIISGARKNRRIPTQDADMCHRLHLLRQKLRDQKKAIEELEKDLYVPCPVS